MQRFPPGTQVTQTETVFVHIREGPAFTFPVCLLVKGEGPERRGMTVSGTRPAFPSAPGVRAKAEKGEVADYRLTCKAFRK